MAKYGNRKVIIDGIAFDSVKEGRRYQELKLLVKANKIKDLQMQVKYVLIPSQRYKGKVVERECSYVADFVYVDIETGETVVEDVKGYRTEKYIIKRKLLLYKYGLRIKEV